MAGARHVNPLSFSLSVWRREREEIDTAARASFGLQPSQNPRITFASSCFQQHLERARERYGRQQTIGVCVCECVLGERKGRLCAEKSTGELIENFQAFLSLPPHNGPTGVLSQSNGNNPAGERAARAAMRPLPRLVPAACWRNNLFGPTSREHEAFNARRQANRLFPSLSSLSFLHLGFSFLTTSYNTCS